MDSLLNITETMMSMSELIADAIIKRTSPVQDDISERQAETTYGTRWLRKMKQEGLAKYSRIGGRVIYSRHQLDCLRAAEREQARIVSKKYGIQ